MPVYQAHGLRIDSDIDIRDFGNPVAKDQGADIRIYQTDYDSEWDWPEFNPENWINLHPRKQIVRITIDEIVEFLVKDGQEIQYVLGKDGDREYEFRAYLLGRTLGTLLYQRRQFPLHGSAVDTPEGAVIFVGDSGAGKSTLVYQFLELGYNLLADDVSCIRTRNDQAVVLPGIRRNKLWQKSLDWFGVSSQGLEEVVEQEGKYQLYSKVQEANHGGHKVAGIIELVPFSDVSEPRIETMDRKDFFRLNFEHNYLRFFIGEMGLQQEFLDHCVDLHSRIPVKKLVRPKGMEHLNDIANLVLEDLKS